jgi:hypothetical protein
MALALRLVHGGFCLFVFWHTPRGLVLHPCNCMHPLLQVYTEAYATSCNFNSSTCPHEMVYRGAVTVQPGRLHLPHTLATFSTSSLAAGEVLTFSLHPRDALNNSVRWDQLPAEDFQVGLGLTGKKHVA